MCCINDSAGRRGLHLNQESLYQRAVFECQFRFYIMSLCLFNRSLKPYIKTLWYVKVLHLKVEDQRVKLFPKCCILQKFLSRFLAVMGSLAEFGVRGWLSDKGLGSTYRKCSDRPNIHYAPSCQNELPGRGRLEAEIK